jgi:hypothetical protein
MPERQVELDASGDTIAVVAGNKRHKLVPTNYQKKKGSGASAEDKTMG